MRLLRIEAPHYVAGISYKHRWFCRPCAPILSWMVGKDRDFILDYLEYKGYKWEWLD